MRMWILLAVTALVAAYAIFARDRAESPYPDHSGVASSDSSDGVTRTDAAKPRNHARSSDDAPRLPSRRIKVAIDTSPRRPGEMYITYKNRIQIAQDFRDFVREAGVTEEQANDLLLAMYDFQQNSIALRDSRVANSDVPADEWRALVRENTRVFVGRIEYILTESQQRVWWELCASCYIRLGEGVLHLQDRRPGAAVRQSSRAH